MDRLMTTLLLGLAAYRATRLVVHDSIGDRLRLKLEIWHAKRHTSAVRTFLRDLVACPYCAGWWLSTATALVWFTATGSWGRDPLGLLAVQAWAVAGVQALLNRWDDTRTGE